MTKLLRPQGVEIQQHWLAQTVAVGQSGAEPSPDCFRLGGEVMRLEGHAPIGWRPPAQSSSVSTTIQVQSRTAAATPFEEVT